MRSIQMKYSKEFKEETIKLSDGIGVKKACTQLGLPYYTIVDWQKDRKANECEIASLSPTDQQKRIPAYKINKAEVKNIFISTFAKTVRVGIINFVIS